MTSPARPEPECATCNDKGLVTRVVTSEGNTTSYPERCICIYGEPCDTDHPCHDVHGYPCDCPDCTCQDCFDTGRLPCERHQSPNCPCHREPCPCRSLEVD